MQYIQVRTLDEDEMTNVIDCTNADGFKIGNNGELILIKRKYTTIGWDDINIEVFAMGAWIHAKIMIREDPKKESKG